MVFTVKIRSQCSSILALRSVEWTSCKHVQQSIRRAHTHLPTLVPNRENTMQVHKIQYRFSGLIRHASWSHICWAHVRATTALECLNMSLSTTAAGTFNMSRVASRVRSLSKLSGGLRTGDWAGSLCCCKTALSSDGEDRDETSATVNVLSFVLPFLAGLGSMVCSSNS